MNNNIALDVVQTLRDCQAIFINTQEFFTYSSGIKSPIYCDNRVLISHPAARKKIAQYLADMIKEKCPDVELIAATATGAIAHGAWVADILNLPMVYILGKNKAHGRSKKIEGSFAQGAKTVILEDLISTGGSSIAAVSAAREHGLDVAGVFAIFSYEFNKAQENFASVDCPLHTLSGFSAFDQLLTAEELAILKDWKADQ